MTTYLQNAWYAACLSEELAQPVFRKIMDEPIVLYRTEDGTAVALDDRCPHRFASLHQGKVRGETIECPYHGLRFDPSGACVYSPHAGGKVPPHTGVKAYPLQERHGAVWLWTGDAALADAASIPDYSLFERTDIGLYWGYLRIEGNYQLIVDNLLDLSHAEFIHPYLSTEGWNIRVGYSATQEGDTVTAHYSMKDEPPLPLWKATNPNIPDKGEMFAWMKWTLPSTLEMDTGFQADGHKISMPSLHMITPETEKSAHYYFIGARSFDVDNEALTAQFRQMVVHTFETEDKPMIERQQINIGDAQLMDLRPAILGSDSAAVRARRMLAQRVREEGAQRGGAKLVA
jgi:vanillate O-demethylase monooxygenase subunit